MNKKHALMLLLLSLILISLSCVNAENDKVSDIEQGVSNENPLENSYPADCADNQVITKNLHDFVKEDYSQTHYVNNTDDLYKVLDKSEELTGKHIIDLNDKEFIVNKSFIIYNDELELIFNGNGNQLTLRDNLAFSVKNVVFNDLIIEFDDRLDSRDIIDNYGNMNLNNVTVKDTMEYNQMVSIFKDKGFYDFDDWDGVQNTFAYSTRGMNLLNKGVLHVNNSHFINNSGHSGTSIYNDGKVTVENTVFEDSLAKFGIIYSNNDSIIKNCEFKNNKVFQQLLLTQGNSELINVTFSNNIIAGSSILDNRGSINIKDCKFEKNTAKYELVENWGYMDASNLNLSNNTCDTLINSFGNMTLKDSLIKDNGCNSSIICRNTIYVANTDDIDSAGNVTLENNKIFRGNVEYVDFLNNQNTGVLSLYNNTIYDEPDYEGDCIFDGNTFIADKNLYDDEGNYHGQRMELEINGHINYEIVEMEYSGAVIRLYCLEPVYVDDNMEVWGYLNDKNNKSITEKEVSISITDPENTTTFFNPITNSNGIFTVNYLPTIPGNYTIFSFYESDNQYETATENMEVVVSKRPVDTTITINPIAENYTLGDEIIISGTLTGLNNNPLSNENISIVIEKENYSESDNILVDYVLTDDNGNYNYTYTADTAGPIYIEVYWFSSPGYTSSQNNTSTYVVDSEFKEGILTLDPVYSKLYLGDTLIISGCLTDLDNNPLSDKIIGIKIDGGESDYGIYSYNYNTTTDENGKYTYQHKLNDEGVINILVYLENDDVYGYLENRTASYVGQLENNESQNMNNETNTTDNINNETNTSENINNNITPKMHHKTFKSHRIQNKPFNKHFYKKFSDKIFLKHNTNITLSWLNDIFKDDFKNKSLLIYIDDILVFNGTTSDDSSLILFKVLEEYSGEHYLKVIADNNTYQKLVDII